MSGSTSAVKKDGVYVGGYQVPQEQILTGARRLEQAKDVASTPFSITVASGPGICVSLDTAIA
jgi:hypothetical protein